MFVKEKREKRKQVLKRPGVGKHQIARPYKRWLCALAPCLCRNDLVAGGGPLTSLSHLPRLFTNRMEPLHSR